MNKIKSSQWYGRGGHCCIHFPVTGSVAMTLLTHRRKGSRNYRFTLDVQKFLRSVVDNPDTHFYGAVWLAISLGFHFSLKRVLGNVPVVQTEITWQNPKADIQARVIKCSNTRSVIVTSECLEWCNVSLERGKGQPVKTSILKITFSTFGYVSLILMNHTSKKYERPIWTKHV